MSNDQIVRPNGLFEISGQKYGGFFDGRQLVIESEKSIPDADRREAQKIAGVWNNLPTILENAHCIGNVVSQHIYSRTQYRYTWEPESVYWGDLSIRGKEELFIATTGQIRTFPHTGIYYHSIGMNEIPPDIEVDRPDPVEIEFLGESYTLTHSESSSFSSSSGELNISYKPIIQISASVPWEDFRHFIVGLTQCVFFLVNENVNFEFSAIGESDASYWFKPLLALPAESIGGDDREGFMQFAGRDYDKHLMRWFREWEDKSFQRLEFQYSEFKSLRHTLSVESQVGILASICEKMALYALDERFGLEAAIRGLSEWVELPEKIEGRVGRLTKLRNSWIHANWEDGIQIKIDDLLWLESVIQLGFAKILNIDRGRVFAHPAREFVRRNLPSS